MTILYRRNVVREALKAQRRDIHELLIDKKADATKSDIGELFSLAQKQGIRIKRVEKQHLNDRTKGAIHQGVALVASDYPYVDVEDILDRANASGEPAFILALDQIQSPSNVGRLLRTADAIGVHGVIMQDRRNAAVNAEVVEASMGAAEHTLVAQVTNLVQALKQLQKEDIWLVGLDIGQGAQTPDRLRLDGALCLVVGNEGEGLRTLVRKTCDLRMFLPMRGHVDSLNASVAASIALYMAWQARGW